MPAHEAMHHQQKEYLMNKLLTVLLASFFAAGGAMAATSGSGALSGSTSGSVSGSTNNNTNTALSSNANVNTNSNTNTNNVNVYGPGSNKLARRQPSSGTNVSMMPGHGSKPSGTRTAQAEPRSTHSCPPGLAKKNNGCMPPGLAKDRDDTHTMGNTGSRPTRHHHRLSLRDRDDRRHER
jgi:hypothetical protein